jgi:hypothetical protein
LFFLTKYFIIKKIEKNPLGVLIKAERNRPLEPDLVKTNVGKWQINDYQGRFATFFAYLLIFLPFITYIMEAKL